LINRIDTMNTPQPTAYLSKAAFTLIEVVLALGIFLVTVLALVGLLGPTLKSVSNVEDSDEVISVVNTLNAFLQNSTEIANANQSKFETIYNAIETSADGYATVFVFKEYQGSTEIVGVQVGFETPVTGATVTDFSNAAGQIYRVVLSASSVTPAALRSAERANGVFTLTSSYANYPEGYFAMEARIFAREQDMQAVNGVMPAVTLGALNDEEPLFTYNTAIVR